MSKRAPRIARGHQKLGRGLGELSLGPPEGVRPCAHLGFGHLASGTMREYTSVDLSYAVGGVLLQRPQEANAPGLWAVGVGTRLGEGGTLPERGKQWAGSWGSSCSPRVPHAHSHLGPLQVGSHMGEQPATPRRPKAPVLDGLVLPQAGGLAAGDGGEA